MAKFQMWVGNTSPSLLDTLSVDGEPFPIPDGSVVTFSMREIATNTLKIDHEAAVIVTPIDGEIRYDWEADDVDVAGEYVGWWEITLPNGNSQDSDEFSISIGTHDMLTDLATNFTWPSREYLDAVSDFDWSEISHERFLAWSRGVMADISVETGRPRSYFTGLLNETNEAQYAREVWQLLMEQRHVKRRFDVGESEYDDTYSSMSVTGYSETKPSLKDRNPIFARMVNSSPEIARKLWHLMTDAKKDELRAESGEVVAREHIMEIDWFAGPLDEESTHNPGGWVE